MFKAYGANPTPMSFSEVFTALQTGVIDGQENPFAQIYSAKFQEVQKYLSLTGHVYTPAYVTVGKKRPGTAAGEVRKVLEETAKETQAFVYDTAARLETDLLDKLRRRRHRGQRGRQGRLHRRQQADLRRVRAVGAGRQGARRHGHRPGN